MDVLFSHLAGGVLNVCVQAGSKRRAEDVSDMEEEAYEGTTDEEEGVVSSLLCLSENVVSESKYQLCDLPRCTVGATKSRAVPPMGSQECSIHRSWRKMKMNFEVRGRKRK
mgnify:CR=1 FL=1